MTELSNDHLGERLSRLWFRYYQLWSELMAFYCNLLRLPPLTHRDGSSETSSPGTSLGAQGTLPPPC
jgi:hypothetical protein